MAAIYVSYAATLNDSFITVMIASYKLYSLRRLISTQQLNSTQIQRKKVQRAYINLRSLKNQSLLFLITLMYHS